MRSIKTYSNLIVSLLTLFAISGCIKDDLISSDQRSREYIGFSAALSVDTRSAQGRGNTSYLDIIEQEWPLAGDDSSAQTRGKTTNKLNNLEVGMYAHPLTNTAIQTAVMDNHLFKFVDNEELEAVANPVLWESISSADKLRVYGYSPYVATANTNFSTSTADGKTTITYTVPNDVAAQQDIIATDVKEVTSTYCQNIPLTFRHILTGVRFKTGFECTVKSLKVTGVYNKGTFTIGDVWKDHTATATPVEYTLPVPDSGKNYQDEYITDEILMMIPQRLPDNAQVVMTYTENGTNGTITAPLKGLKWEAGALVTYIIHKEQEQPYIYFDLHAGNVKITPQSYQGYVWVKGMDEPQEVSGTGSTEDKHFYIYQSTDENKNNYGYASAEDYNKKQNLRLPSYAPVMVGNQFWSDFITNNTSVEDVIETWDTEGNIRIDASAQETMPINTSSAVRQVSRSSTANYINVTGEYKENDVTTTEQINCFITIDNIYSRHQQFGQSRSTGGITFSPKEDYSSLTINLVGDNRIGNIHYFSGRKKEIGLFSNNNLILQGTGSLTVATVDFVKSTTSDTRHTYTRSDSKYKGDNIYGYKTNWWCSAIGGNDQAEGHAIGIIIKNGTIFAGTTQTENCTAIGGGGNDQGYITIEGGSITAVACTTGTAIGGGIGYTSYGGIGNVKITGGTVYAYNHANEWEIPSAAIGSAGSWESNGGNGYVEISGGYVYAQTALGTAIGGGSSKSKQGGDATVIISGNSYVIAKSISAIDNHPEANKKEYPAGNGIGGGTGGTGDSTIKNPDGTYIPAFGGSATIKISGNPTIRTGSIGGGKTNNPKGNIGSADITINGGDISAQFIMAGGAAKPNESGEMVTSTPIFQMTDGTISNSDVHSNEFYHVQTLGGAVYMEDGEFTMSGNAKILNCKADIGGAVYMKQSENAAAPPKFSMSGGRIENCTSSSNGGAVYLEGGDVEMTGGLIQGNLAANGNGGGIYISKGNLDITGTAQVLSNSALKRSGVPSIKNDTKTGNGGGIYVSSSSNVEVNILAGEIKNNTCDQNGGGVCVDMAVSSDETDTPPTANIQIGDKNTQTGPSIDDNKAVLYGGGLYAEGVNAIITIDGGSISNNNVANYVHNEDVANEGGTVKLYNGNVTHVVVTFDVNTPQDTPYPAEVVGGEQYQKQKVVKATNSFLVAPDAKRDLYIFMGWDSRKDGKGERYQAGDTIPMNNLTEDLALYAQWQSQ